MYSYNTQREASNIKKIALYGGTFNPIHFGHLVVAENVRAFFDIDEVIFIPTGIPPEKEDKSIIENKLSRLEMVRLATNDNPYFTVSDIEIKKTVKCYTRDTLIDIRKLFSDAKLFFILGADAIRNISKWHNAENIFTLCEFIAVSRGNYNNKTLLTDIEYLEDDFNAVIHFLEIPNIGISSTDIRKKSSIGKTIKYLVPSSVEQYIEDNNLYAALDYEHLDAILRANLSKDKYEHTIGTANEAKSLATHYDLDTTKAYIAGLFHDITKEYNEEEILAHCEKYSTKLDAVLRNNLPIAHGFLSADIAKKDFSIEDEDILNAIRYHTFGRANMSMLEKIVFVADCIEPTRGENSWLQELRAIAYEDIDKAMVICLEFALEKTKKRQQAYHPLGLEALEYLKENEND